MRRALTLLAALVVAGLVLALLLGAFSGDDGGAGTLPPAPGQTTAAPTGALGRLLARGDVVVAYRDPADAAAARARATALGGAPAAALVAAGQAVVARAAPGQGPRFAALAWQRTLPLASLASPALDAFVDRWLGRGSGDPAD